MTNKHNVRVLIITNKILEYRKTLFNLIAKECYLDIAHSGNTTKDHKTLYNEFILSRFKIGSFIFQFINKNLNLNKYNVIVLNFDLHFIMNLFLIIFMRKKTKIILWGHRYSENKNFSIVINFIKNYFLKKAHGVILYTDTNVKKLIMHGIDENKIFVADNTIDVPNNCFNDKVQRNTILFVGRAQKRKKIDLLINSFYKIKDQIDQNIRVTIIGSGRENIELKKQVSSLKLDDKVTFISETHNPDELIDYFQKAIIYASPGHVGLGVLHSFAYGVPVLTIKSNNHAEEFDNLLHNTNSFIASNENEFTKALLDFCLNTSKSYDLGLRAYDFYIEKKLMSSYVKKFMKAIYE